ncbi:hypothetical protein Tco_0451066 [Tanacetum coccineum]
MSMTIQSSVKDKILATLSETSKVENALAEILRDLDQQMEKRADDAQSEAFKQENVLVERLRALDQQMGRKEDETDKKYYNLRDMYWWPGMKRDIAIYVSRLFYGQRLERVVLIGLELVQETTDKEMTDKVVVIKEKLKTARDRQKSYANNKRKSLEFEVGDHVMLKVSPWKGMVRFGKKGKLAPRNANLHVPLNEIKIDKTLRFVEEPVEIIDREVKSLKRSRIPLVKVRWNSKRGPEFTWEREDYMKSKYPQLFVDRAVEPTS